MSDHDDITRPAERIRERIREQAADDGGGEFGAKWNKLDSKFEGEDADIGLKKGPAEELKAMDKVMGIDDGVELDDITGGTGASKAVDDIASKLDGSIVEGYTAADQKSGSPDLGYTAADKTHKGGTPERVGITSEESAIPDPVGDLIPPLEDPTGGDPYETVTLSMDDASEGDSFSDVRWEVADEGLGDDLDGV